MQSLFLGIDVGNTHCQVHGLAVDTGEVFTFSVETLNLREWKRKLSPLAEEYRISACFEVGPHYEWMYDELMKYCIGVDVVNPNEFALIKKSFVKTDKRDAEKLCDGVIRGDLPRVFVPEKEARADRRLVRHVHTHSQQLSCIKGRIRSLLFSHCLKCPHTDILASSSVKWLKKHAFPKIGVSDQLILDNLLAVGLLLREQRKVLDEKLEARAQTYEDNRILKSIKGFGPLTRLAILSSIVDISRFGSPKKLAAYWGVVPGIYQSGQINRIQGLTHQGNVTVRWLLSQCLSHLHRFDLKAKERYQRLKRKKVTGVARGAQVRWIATILWHLLSKKERYRIKTLPQPKNVVPKK